MKRVRKLVLTHSATSLLPFRELRLTYSLDEKKKRDRLVAMVRGAKYRKAFAERNLKFVVRRRRDRSQLFNLSLYGYDGKLKYVTNKVSSLSMVIKKIDAMPVRKREIREKIKSIELYTDSHPETTVQGTGYKDKATAEKTLKKIRRLSSRRQYLIIHTLYYRAKYHPHPTPGMKEAMRLFRVWLQKKKRPSKK